jgi:hypothetical protein
MGGKTGIAGAGGFQPDGCAAAAGYAQNLELCRGAFVHRVGTSVCLAPPRSVEGSAGADGEGGAGPGDESDSAAGSGGTGVAGECVTDWDCTRRPNGFCVFLEEEGGGEKAYSYCHYACEYDTDCAESELCSCGHSFFDRGQNASVQLGVCRSASCTLDADCGEGLMCSSPVDSECGPPVPTGFHCQSWDDECAGPGDCAEDEECSHDGARFVCDARLVCGRPFLVGDRARLADAAGRKDWMGARIGLVSSGLDQQTCAVIARHWTDAALAEHASVAALGRFTLELMSLGAPEELVAASMEAMRDETRHATLCFGLASRYAATAVGPSALDMSGAFADGDFLAVVDRAIVEGVIGETAAALEATWAREAATDAEVRAALEMIAVDEALHAALAIRFVAWAAKRDPRVVTLLERRLQEAARASEGEVDVRPALAPNVIEQLEFHGVLDAATRRAARRAVLLEVLPSVIAQLRAGACPQPGYASKHGEARRFLG